jgi:hypothetical protein
MVPVMFKTYTHLLNDSPPSNRFWRGRIRSNLIDLTDLDLMIDLIGRMDLIADRMHGCTAVHTGT